MHAPPRLLAPVALACAALLGACEGAEHAGSGGSVAIAGSSAGGAAGAAGGAGGQAAGGTGVGGQSAGGGGAGYDGPRLLSETGLYSNIATRQLASGVQGYGVRYPLWSDGSVKTRYVWLPPGAQIDTSDADHWDFPVGTKAWKQFERSGKLIETRLVEKTADGFEAVAYEWRADGSDADVRPEGVENVAGTSHDVPSQGQCLECHTNSHDYFLGLTVVQLSTSVTDSELQRMALRGWFSAPMSVYQAPGTPEQAAGLGYLHGNCGHCHRVEHPIGQKLGLQLLLRSGDQDFESTGFAVSTPNAPAKHVIGGTAVIVTPGEPSQSQLWVRSGLRDLEGMPPLGTEQVNPSGQDAIAALIRSLEP